MRKEAKQIKTAKLYSVQGYHQGGYGHGEQYAFLGFVGNWYFNSDRKIELDEHYQRKDGQPMQGYGLEIETECFGVTSDDALAAVYSEIIFPTFKFGAQMFKMQRDATLNGTSNAEVITQVMTKLRIRNDYTAYKLMFNHWFKVFGIRSDCYANGCGCGMHVNVSNGVFGKTEKAREEAIRKLYYIINKHYTLACKLFYRNPAKTHWCAQMDYSVAKTMNLHNMPASHGNCFNGSHYDAGRIELRIVGGQKDYGCFRNTMESVFFLCERVQQLSWTDCDDVTKIFQGCNQYVFDRLESRCGLSASVLDAIRETVIREELV